MTTHLRRALLGALLLLLAIPPSRAEDPALSLVLGGATRLVVARAVETVMIGDPLVVDVRVDDDRSITIDSLNPGVTNVVLVDASGIVIANIRVLVCAAWSSACGARSPSGDTDLAKPAAVRQDARRAQLHASTARSAS